MTDRPNCYRYRVAVPGACSGMSIRFHEHTNEDGSRTIIPYCARCAGNAIDQFGVAIQTSPWTPDMLELSLVQEIMES